jgi:tRNA U34 5-methylaminomethyl-2-thiouridine-forming methyltransferase MnmC
MQIINTSDGSQTIYLPEINEQYHSVNGAVTESEYVYIEKGFLFHPGKNQKVFEVGFGTGLNCILTVLQAEQHKKPTKYIAIEKFPLEKSITDQLNYGRQISEHAQNIFEKIHDCSWNQEVRISEYFVLHKINGDLLNFSFNEIENCTVIYFDAFGPDKQPEMWSPLIFSKISSITLTGGILVTYSAKGEVRRQLSASGFSMERLPGPPGKKEMLRGIKKESKI